MANESGREPVLPGQSGWLAQRDFPELAPDRPGPLGVDTRHYPAAIRVLSVINPAPFMADYFMYAAVRRLSQLNLKRALKKYEPRDDNEAALKKWIYSSPLIRAWWASSLSWRSPREFKDWRTVEREMGVPHLEPYEFAEMRLPEDIAMDADVVVLQSWSQGVTRGVRDEVVDRWDGWADPHGCMVAGLRKVHSSPWVKLSIASPFMQPVGVLFPGVPFIASCQRLEYLLEHPYRATIPELHHILHSPGFLVAYDRARVTRRRGTYVNPGGGWYACGLRNPLGGHFKRGGLWTGHRGSK